MKKTKGSNRSLSGISGRKIKEACQEIESGAGIELQVRQKDLLLQAVFDSISDPAYIKDAQGRYIVVNTGFEDFAELRKDAILGRSDWEIFPPWLAASFGKTDRAALEGNPVSVNESFPSDDGDVFFEIVKTPLATGCGEVYGLIGICRNVTARKKVEAALSETEKERLLRAQELEETNSALRVLLRQRDHDRKDLEEKMAANIKHLILPYILKIRGNLKGSAELVYLNILESNLKEIISSFTIDVSSKHYGLTPKEILVADLVRDGRQDKEIMEILHISIHTVKTYRRQIRRKLGLNGKRTSLRTHLLTF